MERFAKAINVYNYFRSISFSSSLLFEINVMNFKNMPNFYVKSISKVILILPLRYTNADMKISLYILNHVKVIQWKFPILNRKNS